MENKKFLLAVTLCLSVIVNLAHGMGNCEQKAHEEIMECKEDFDDRMDDDIGDRKQCCAFVKYRHCVKQAYEDECEDDERTAHQEYEKWRNMTEYTHPELSLRCRDDSHDTFECTFLNHMALWITLFTFLLIFTCVALLACIWMVIKNTGTTSKIFGIN